ncbi:MAG: hypothetical protein LIO75_00645 [Lachnospiraceae bacterium]|nr:hypothetical protein [Lachnospiraceae bacterium]
MMDQQQYYDRQTYVEQVRSSFGEPSEQSKPVSYDRECEVPERRGRSFFKVRLILAVLLFLGFVVLRQTGWSFQEIDADRIQEEISRSISLPESVPNLSELIHVTEEGTAE